MGTERPPDPSMGGGGQWVDKPSMLQLLKTIGVQNPERRKNGYEVLPRIFDMGLLNGCPCQVGEGSKEQLILEELVYTSHCSDFVKFA